MRYYIRKEDLILTLNELTQTKDQTIIQVYKDVMMYRFSNHPQDYKHVEEMLLKPRQMILVLINIFLSFIALSILPVVFRNISLIQLKTAVIFILYAFLGVQVLWAYHLSKTIHEFFPYVVIDELLARKIIVLTHKKKSVKQAKAVK